ITFDRVVYDATGDVLYLHIGDPSSAVDFDESPEGHALRYDADRQLVGLTIVNAKWLLDRGPLAVTIPQRVQVDPATLAQVIGGAG
ncbi:MAG: DUF2283 domain-containing protein, partial [Candidatus Dormibacteria bacterium]